MNLDNKPQPRKGTVPYTAPYKPYVLKSAPPSPIQKVKGFIFVLLITCLFWGGLIYILKN